MNDRDAWQMLDSVQGHSAVEGWLREAERAYPEKSRGVRRRRHWAIAAGVAGVALLAAVTYRMLGPVEYSTGRGEQRFVLLEDGSRISLNTETLVSVRYTRKERRIVMRRGEALFDVQRDPGRPFEVVAGQTLTRAVGTEFNIDMRSGEVHVSVLEGLVRVTTPQRGSEDLGVSGLSAGEALEFIPKRLEVHREEAELARIQGWRARRLDFSDAPLSEAVEEFNRYSAVPIVLGSEELAEVRVSGVFSIGDTAGFLYSLESTLGVRQHRTGNEVILTR